MYKYMYSFVLAGSIRTTNRVFWVQQVIIKYIQDMIALDLAVQLVLARKPANRRIAGLFTCSRPLAGPRVPWRLRGPWPAGNLELDFTSPALEQVVVPG